MIDVSDGVIWIASNRTEVCVGEHTYQRKFRALLMGFIKMHDYNILIIFIGLACRV